MMVNLRRLVQRIVASFLVVLLGASAVLGADPPSLLDVVRGYADAMLQHGRDTFGPLKSGLLLSAMDRMTLAPLTTRPAAPAGIRREDRVGAAWEPLTGANPHLDENLLRILYTLTAITGDKRYAQAADDELKWFFTNTLSPKTNLLPWGEHLSWDVIADKVVSGHGESVHEFSRPWVLWDRCFELAPEESKRFALGLWEHQIADHKTGAYDRHAPYFRHGPKNGMDFGRHGAFYIGTWSYAYKYTKADVFLNAIETILNRFEKKRNPKTGYMPWCCDRTFGGPGLGEAIDCESAAERVPEPLASRLRKFAAREDELFLRLPHDPKGKGFAHTVDLATGELLPDGIGTSIWSSAYGGGTTAGFAMGCVARYQQTGKEGYRKLVIDTADAYLDSLPGEDVDAWPLSFGHAISIEMAAYEYTRRDIYLQRAITLARLAVEVFWQDNPLPRASFRTGHYETITGADTLALALLQVHAVVNHLDAKIPENTIDR